MDGLAGMQAFTCFDFFNKQYVGVKFQLVVIMQKTNYDD